MPNLDDRLHNWGRWVRVHRPKSHTLSLEGNYRSPQHWDPPEPMLPPCDRRDALEIESAASLLPLRYHWVLRLRYVDRPRPPDPLVARLLRRRFRLPHTPDVLAEHAMACVLLADALAVPHGIRRIRLVAIVRRIIRGSQDVMHNRLTLRNCCG